MTRCSGRMLFVVREYLICFCLINQHHQYRQEKEKKFVYLITDKILFFAMCCWCNQTHPIASLLITCIQIVTSFFSFTKNLKKNQQCIFGSCKIKDIFSYILLKSITQFPRNAPQFLHLKNRSFQHKGCVHSHFT